MKVFDLGPAMVELDQLEKLKDPPLVLGEAVRLLLGQAFQDDAEILVLQGAGAGLQLLVGNPIKLLPLQQSFFDLFKLVGLAKKQQSIYFE